MSTARCEVCFRHCTLAEGQSGFCGGRICRDGKVLPLNYGRITSLALDPIEKKPLNRFFPGSMILSVGSFGCDMRCPFCQNDSISWSKEALSLSESAEKITPEDLARTAEYYKKDGNIGVAFTYNEPLIGWEFVRDTARLVHRKSMKNVMVTNGMAELSVLKELIPYIDGMNIDLKSFNEKTYRDILGGDMEMVKNFIAEAVKNCHVELTFLAVTDLNDTEEEMRETAGWISTLTDNEGNTIGRNIPLHISRFFPRFNMNDRSATDVRRVYRLADIAREYLDYVYTGNC